VAKTLEVHRNDHDLYDYCTFGVEAEDDAQTVSVNTACEEYHNRKNLSKLILWYRNVYNQFFTFE